MKGKGGERRQEERLGVGRMREQDPLIRGPDTFRMQREGWAGGNQRQEVEQDKERVAISADATEDGC